MLWPLASSQPDVGGKFRSLFLGPAAVFYNGGTFQVIPDFYGKRSWAYADTNVMEAGMDLVYAQETRLSPWGLLAAEARTSYAPLRSVRARYDVLGGTPGRSEVGSHTRFSPAGLGLGMAGVLHVARVVGVGLFGGVSLASPFQVKARAGIMLVLTSPEGPAPMPVSSGGGGNLGKAGKPESPAVTTSTPATTSPTPSFPAPVAPSASAPAAPVAPAPGATGVPPVSPSAVGGPPTQERNNETLKGTRFQQGPGEARP